MVRPIDLQHILDYSWLLWPLQKCFRNQSLFNFSPFRPHQARTCMHDTCITHEIRRRYAQSNLKVTPKCPKSYFHMPKMVPKWLPSNPEVTLELYKIIKIYWENECFLKSDLITSKVTPQWSQSNHKVTQSHPNIPRVTPKWPQSGSKVARLAQLQTFPGVPVAALTLQKCFKNQWFFNFSRFRPHQARTCMHDTCITHAIRRRYAQSKLKVTPKCPKNAISRIPVRSVGVLWPPWTRSKML